MQGKQLVTQPHMVLEALKSPVEKDDVVLIVVMEIDSLLNRGVHLSKWLLKQTTQAAIERRKW